MRCVPSYTGMFEGVRVSVMAGRNGRTVHADLRHGALQGIMAVRSWCGQVPPAAIGTI